MWLLPIALLVLSAPFAFQWWFKRDAIRLIMADRVWGDIEYHAGVLFQDKSLDPMIGDLVEFMLRTAGSGSLTRKFLFSLLTPSRVPEDGLHAVITSLTEGQHMHFYRVAILILFYDSLRAGPSGILLRRIVYWLNATAGDRKAPLADAQVEPILRVAERDCCPA